jgi:hypothetical protein
MEKIPSLQHLSADALSGFANTYAKSFVESNDINDLVMAQVLLEADKQVNTIGRVPGIPPILSRWEVDPDERAIYPPEIYAERKSGKVRGITSFQGINSKGVILRTDCLAIPEMWLEIQLTWEQLEEMVAKRPE